MKIGKQLYGLLAGFVIALSVLLGSPSIGSAQTSPDWSAPVNMSLSGSATTPILVVDINGSIHAIWVDNVDKGYKHSQSADGKTWSTPETVIFPFDPKGSPPVLLSDENGAIHVFWLSGGELFYGLTDHLNLANPSNWNTISSLGRDVLGFDAIFDSNNILNVALIKKASSNSGPPGVYYRQSIIGGGTWSASKLLYASDYFRSAKESDAYVRISTSDNQGNEQVYVTWDDRAKKRIYMAVSRDDGTTWNETLLVKDPQDTGGIDSPFNLTVAASGNRVLLMWQVGDPGSSMCTVYSQWSEDGGNSWGDTIAVLGGRSECPVGIKILDRSGDYISVLLNGQVEPALIAWNGERWSDVQTQIRLPSFSNPLTFDAILLGCRFDFYYKKQLYVTGCDQGKGGDVWFLSRPLEPVEDWFSALSSWGAANILPIESEKPRMASHFTSVADGTGNIHVMWSESSTNRGSLDNSIEYVRWDGNEWTDPETIYGSLIGTSGSLSLTVDSLERLLIAWVDNYNGDLVFGWANLGKANVRSEWSEITGLPSPSTLISSSDSLVDSSGRIITVYAVPVNENRGIYMVQSIDSGHNWSSPIRAFDAASGGWERIENPRLSLSADGVLHLIFLRKSLRDGQTRGLNYSRSEDGGATWSEPQTLSENDIEWAEIVSYSDRTIHVVWQEYDGLVFANVSQESRDGGKTWGKQNNVTGVTAEATSVALASDGHDLLHFVQLVKKAEGLAITQENLVLQDWEWDGNAWLPELTKDVVINGQDISYSLTANITSTGFLGVLLPVQYTDPKEGLKNEILMFKRHLAGAGTGQAFQVATIPTHEVGEQISETGVSEPTATPDFAILYDDKEARLLSQKRVVGIVLVGAIVIVTIVLFIWRSPGRK